MTGAEDKNRVAAALTAGGTLSHISLGFTWSLNSQYQAQTTNSQKSPIMCKKCYNCVKSVQIVCLPCEVRLEHVKPGGETVLFMFRFYK